jgi:hypothetical protein
LNERKSLDARSQGAGGVLRSLAVIGQSEKKKNNPHKDYESTSLNKMMIGGGEQMETGERTVGASGKGPGTGTTKDQG